MSKMNTLYINYLNGEDVDPSLFITVNDVRPKPNNSRITFDYYKHCSRI